LTREQRRLAAILAADVVGYSRLMGRDESGTLARLRAHRGTVLEPAVRRHGGRLVKLTGDGALIEFGSAVDALSAAIEFQQAMADANRDQPSDTAIVFRVGLHLGDLIVDGDDLYGDSVNIAVRLEAHAPAGGIVISRGVHDAVARRIEATFTDLGDLSLKNIERATQAFRVGWDPLAWRVAAAAPSMPVAAPPSTDAPLALPDKPSIAVLPFQNMSGDPEQEHFADGMTEDMITELSRFRSLFVIARNSSFSYKGGSPDIRRVGQELGVRYVLEGSIRKAANRVRVTGQLVDTLAGSHIWAERYDRVLEDIFAVQEEVTQAIVAAIAPQIASAEQSRATRRRPDSLSAYEIALRARAHAWHGQDKADRTLLEQSIREAREALAIDPGCVLALQVLANTLGITVMLEMVPDRQAALRDAMSAAGQAIELDGADPLGYALRGMGVHLGEQVDRYPDGLADARRAHAMNPNDTQVLRILANLEAAVGEPESAIEHGQQVLRLSPRDLRSHATYSLLSFASFGAKRYAEGAAWASRALNDRPRMIQAHFNLAVCLVGAGDIARARAVFTDLRNLAPEFVQRRLRDGTAAYGRPEDRNRALTFLRIAAGLEDPGAADRLR
jgi:adenylate cyclase